MPTSFPNPESISTDAELLACSFGIAPARTWSSGLLID
jgi:hypothetical protein